MGGRQLAPPLYHLAAGSRQVATNWQLALNVGHLNDRTYWNLTTDWQLALSASASVRDYHLSITQPPNWQLALRGGALPAVWFVYVLSAHVVLHNWEGWHLALPFQLTVWGSTVLMVATVSTYVRASWQLALPARHVTHTTDHVNPTVPLRPVATPQSTVEGRTPPQRRLILCGR